MSCYCLYLFGMPRVERDAQAVQIQRRKGLALLAYLAVTSRENSREYLAAMFWPEQDQSSALANLRRELSGLKKILGSDLLLVDRQFVRLNPESDLWLDVAEFNSRIEMAKRLDERGVSRQSPECIAARSEAAALYTGDFMQGFNLPDSQKFDEWQFFQAEELQQSMIANLQILIEDHIDRKSYSPAVEYARQWLAMDLLQESAHRTLMKLYALSGQRAAALRQYQECARVLHEEMGLAASEETTQLYEAIRSRTFPQTTNETPVHNNLPVPATDFIGREKEIRGLQDFLADKSAKRLTTILGPGGTGKTRLAIETARSVAHHFKDGVCFISLAEVQSGNNMISALLSSFGLQHHHREDDNKEQRVFDFLRDRQMLLLMDNFEHLLDSAGLLNTIIERAPDIKILVTSRERLGLTGENLYMLDGMSYPEKVDFEDILEYDAVTLFLKCVSRLQPDFEPDPQDLVAVARICRLVEGMPLALVLAAGWINVISLAEIADEIAQNLDILGTEMQDLPQRQRSMRAVFDYSWNLLSREQRQVLMNCCVFQDGFSRQAAEAIAGASIQSLLALINKTWLQRSEDGRYYFHELVRQYTQSKLERDKDNHNRVRAAHSDYFSSYLLELDYRMKGSQQNLAFEEITIEFANFRTAWLYSLEQDQLETAVQKMLPALFRYCEARARSFELLQLIRAAIKKIQDGNVRIDNRLYACLLTAQAAFFRNGYPVRFGIFGMLITAEEPVVNKAWSFAENLDGLESMGFWGILLTYLYGRMFDANEGLQLLRQLGKRTGLENSSLRFEQKDLQDRLSWETAFCKQLFLQLFVENGTQLAVEIDKVDRFAEEALETFQDLGDELETGITLRLLGQLRYMQHNISEAAQYWLTAQERLLAAGEWATAADLHWYLGDIHLQLGEFNDAFQHYQAMSKVYIDKGSRLGSANMLSKESYEALRYSDIEHALRTRLQSLEFARELEEGSTEGWCLWELGEIYRVMGNVDKAHKYYREAKTQLDRIQDANRDIYYYRGLGDLALAANDFKEAEKNFEKSFQYAVNSYHSWGSAYALSGLGRAVTGMGDDVRSRHYFLEALRQAKKADESGITLTVIAGITEYYAARGDHPRARVYGSLVVNHPLSWNEIKTRTKMIIEKIVDVHKEKPYVRNVKAQNSMAIWDEVDRLIREFEETD